MSGTTPAPATWEDVERRALSCHILYWAVTSVRIGNLTKEEALTAAAMYFSFEREDWLKQETARLMKSGRV